MKILQINSVCGYGSTGNIAVDLYRTLIEQGHECCVAYGRGTAPKDVKSFRIGSDMDVYMHGVLSRITDRHAFYSTRATKKFVKWMQDYNPDVIHLHNLHGYYINIEVLFQALKWMNKPIIWTLHDCWAFTGHCSHYSASNCQKWKIGCEDCCQRYAYPASLFIDSSRKNYEKKKQIFVGLSNLAIVTPSKWLAQEVEKSFLRVYPVHVINNGIDLDTFKPTEGNFRSKYELEDKKIILGVSNVWNDSKGWRFFGDLVKKLDANYKIVLVGLTKRQLRQLDKRILGITRTGSKKELAEIYTTADVFVNPSVEETMGLTTVEALACGTDVLVRNRTALPEIVEFRDACILPEKDELERITRVAQKTNQIEENCRLARKYMKDSQYREYITLYEKMKESKGEHRL